MCSGQHEEIRDGSAEAWGSCRQWQRADDASMSLVRVGLVLVDRNGKFECLLRANWSFYLYSYQQ